MVGLFDSLVQSVQEDFLNEFVRGLRGSLVDQEVADSLSDLLNLALFQIGIKLDLLRGSLGDNLYENSQLVSVLAFDVGENIDQGLSLSEVLLYLVSGKLELVKGGGHSIALDVLHGHLELLGDVINVKFVFLYIGQADLQHSSLQKLLNLLSSGGLLDWGPSDLLNGANSLRRHDLEPLLLLERMLVLVLLLVVFFVNLLVLSFGHCW